MANRERGALARYVVIPVLFLLMLGCIFIVGSWNAFVVTPAKSAAEAAKESIDDILACYGQAAEQVAADMPPLAEVQQKRQARARAYELLYHSFAVSQEGDFLVLDEAGARVLGDTHLLGRYYDIGPSAPRHVLSEMDEARHTVVVSSLLQQEGGRDLFVGKRLSDGYLLFILPSTSLAECLSAPMGTILSDNLGNVIFQSGGDFTENPLGRLAPAFANIENGSLVLWKGARFYVRAVSIPQGYRLYEAMSVDNILVSYLIGLGVLLLAVALFVPLVLVNLRRVARATARAVREESLARLAVSEQKQLESQFNPHFLFNTLETIRFMVELMPKEAVHVIELLSGILRYSVKGPERVTIREDLKHIEAYMEIQKLRFGKRLHFRESIPEALLDCSIPRLILQPILENAVLHGADPEGVVSVCLSAEERGGLLTILVEDAGKGMDEAALEALRCSLQGDRATKGHVGLWNVSRRLRILYGEKYGLALEGLAPGLRVTIRLPIERREYDEADRHSRR